MTRAGFGALAEPNATIASSNLTTACRTSVTVPCGDTLTVRAASACSDATAAAPSAATAPMRQSSRVMVGWCLLLVLRCFIARLPSEGSFLFDCTRF